MIKMSLDITNVYIYIYLWEFIIVELNGKEEIMGLIMVNEYKDWKIILAYSMKIIYPIVVHC